MLDSLFNGGSPTEVGFALADLLRPILNKKQEAEIIKAYLHWRSANSQPTSKDEDSLMAQFGEIITYKNLNVRQVRKVIIYAYEKKINANHPDLDALKESVQRQASSTAKKATTESTSNLAVDSKPSLAARSVPNEASNEASESVDSKLKVAADIAAEPNLAENNTAPAQASDSQALPARVEVFNFILSLVLAQVKRRHPEAAKDLKRNLVSDILKARIKASDYIDDNQRQVVQNWIDHSAHQVPPQLATASVSAEILTQLINDYYVWCCEEFGPVYTDQVFLYAIQETENECPFSGEYPPSQYM